MSDEKFIVGDADGPKLVPVETKDHSTDIKLTDEQLKKRAEHETETTKEVIGPLAISPELLKKAKRGRPKKVEEKPFRQWRCATCQEVFDDKAVMKIGAGTDRYAVFCPMCQKSLGFEDPVVRDTVADLIKNNPTGKNAKA